MQKIIGYIFKIGLSTFQVLLIGQHENTKGLIFFVNTCSQLGNNKNGGNFLKICLF